MKLRFLSLLQQLDAVKIPFIALLFAVTSIPAVANAQSSSSSGGAFGGTPTVTTPSRIQQGAGQFTPGPPLTPSGTSKPASSTHFGSSPIGTSNTFGNPPLRPTQDGSTSTEPLPPKQNQSPNKQISSAGRSRVVNLDTCFVKLIEDIDVPAEESGKLIRVGVKPGQLVDRGSAIAQMDDQRSRRALEEATLRQESASRMARDTTEIKSANKKMILARRELEDIRKLAVKGSESKQAYQRAKYAFQIAELEFQAAKNQKSLAGLEALTQQVSVNAANDSISRNALTSPVNGIVFEVFKDGGEWVTAGETIMRIARMDRLRIQGFVEADKYDPNQVRNRAVTVTTELANESLEFSGQIVFVSPEKVNNRFKVWAEVDNIQRNGGWMLQAEGEVTMQIHLDQNGSSMTQRNPRRIVPR